MREALDDSKLECIIWLTTLVSSVFVELTEWTLWVHHSGNFDHPLGQVCHDLSPHIWRWVGRRSGKLGLGGQVCGGMLLCGWLSKHRGEGPLRPLIKRIGCRNSRFKSNG